MDYIKIDGEIKRIDNVEEKLNDLGEKYEGARLTWSTTPFGPAKDLMDDAKLALETYTKLIGYNPDMRFRGKVDGSHFNFKLFTIYILY